MVVSSDYASELRVADVPQLARDKETLTIGKLTAAALSELERREVVELLLASHILRTFWHVDAMLCLTGETTAAEGYRARFDAEHNYYTSEHVSPRYRFSIRIAPDGIIDAIGEWHE